MKGQQATITIPIKLDVRLARVAKKLGVPKKQLAAVVLADYVTLRGS